ncbi:MAG: hypothetical protein M3498_02485 [Deinococcota bacterium]|jgi:hypothetical protein|nr:hypothetical protein [Deinococcota bacterium]
MAQAAQPSPVACNLAAFTPKQRERYNRLLESLRQATVETRELPDGYAFRFATDESTWMKVAEYVSLERLCCPFFEFKLIHESEGGAVWLHMTGREVKEFLSSQLR